VTGLARLFICVIQIKMASNCIGIFATNSGRVRQTKDLPCSSERLISTVCCEIELPKSGQINWCRGLARIVIMMTTAFRCLVLLLLLGLATSCSSNSSNNVPGGPEPAAASNANPQTGMKKESGGT
jgi:hypothetical protein